MSSKIRRSTPMDSILLVVDIQDKLLAKMPTAASLVQTVDFLCDVAKILSIHMLVTEQYPAKLGLTTAALADKLPQVRLAKTAFSCCGAAGFLQELRQSARQTIVITGMEAHVCVTQTALDLLEEGYRVVLPVDAVASRHQIDYAIGIRRLEREGAILTTAEALVFEWLSDASHPKFKEVSLLVIQRDKTRLEATQQSASL